jgi:hypothetical protein
LAPARPVWAEVAGGDGALLIRIETAHLLPVEVIGLEFDEAGLVPVVRSWVAAASPPAPVAEAEGVVLPARRAAPATAVIEVPTAAIPTAQEDATRRLRIVTRVWGADDTVSVPVAPGDVSTWEDF